MDLIRVLYDESTAEGYCFLRYFGMACGILVVDGDERIQEGKAGREGRAAVVRLEEGIAPGDSLLAACQDEGEAKNLRELLGIFGETGLWGAAWFACEMSFCRNQKLDGVIKDACGMASERLDALGKKSFWHAHMRLFCKFLECTIDSDRVAGRHEKCGQLLQKCRAIGEKYGYRPALDTLIAKVSRLDPLEEKYAQGYYLAAADAVGWTSELAYGMGTLFQEVLGEEEEAMRWFKKAYSLNPMDFRALYRLAVKEEAEGNWMKALAMFQDVRQMAKRNGLPGVSVRGIEFQLKSLEHIIFLVDENFEPGFARGYQEDMEILQAGDGIRKDMRELAGMMFMSFGHDEARSIGEEIAGEIIRKIR